MKNILLAILCVMLISPSAFALEKNVNSQKWSIFCFDRTDNTAKTGDLGQITGSIWKDGVEDVIADGNPTETAHGQYYFDLDQAESNCEHCVMDAVSATGDIQCVGMPMGLWTTPPAFSDQIIQTGDSYARIGAAGVGLTEAGGDGDHLDEAGGTGDQLTAIDLPNQTMDISGTITTATNVGTVTTLTGQTPQSQDHTTNVNAIKLWIDRAPF